MLMFGFRAGMKTPIHVGLLAVILVAGSSAHAQSSKLFTFSVSPREDVQFGDLINAPNGHLSYETNSGGFKIWVAGRLKAGKTNQEGGFLLSVADWNPTNLARAQASFCLGPTNPGVGDAFDRDYAALDAVVPGQSPGTLLGFYDAEFHPLSTPTNRVGQPLLSSIGLAISTDGGVTWSRQGQVIQGLDWAMMGKEAVASNQVYLATHSPKNIVDDGANSPTAVLRDEGGQTYIYLYYSDRTNFAVTNAYAIYLARSLLASNGQPGQWQKWTGAGWGAVGAQFPAAAVVSAPANRLEAEHGSVSFNTALNCWVMFFKTHTDFQLATSDDGVQWNPAVSLFPFDPNDLETGFPTFVSPVTDYPTQQATGGQGWLYYSSHPTNSNYLGHRVPVLLQSTAPQLRIQSTGSGVTLSWLPPTTGFGLEMTTNVAGAPWSPAVGTNGTTLPLDWPRKFFRLRQF